MIWILTTLVLIVFGLILMIIYLLDKLEEVTMYGNEKSVKLLIEKTKNIKSTKS
jgi:hypothetical protein